MVKDYYSLAPSEFIGSTANPFTTDAIGGHDPVVGAAPESTGCGGDGGCVVARGKLGRVGRF